jgi:hypothetical protein
MNATDDSPPANHTPEFSWSSLNRENIIENFAFFESTGVIRANDFMKR